MASCEKDHLPQNPSKLINGVSMDRFSQVCDNFIDFQVPNQTLEEVSSVLKNGANIALVTNHQSYFEIEAIRYFCQRLNQVSEKPIPSVLFYSAPAVESNTKFLLETRLPIYRQHGLILLPIIRQVDKTNKYQECITPEMRSQTRKSLQLYADTIKQGGCLLIHPFELTLQGGRLNLMTGEINGIQPNKEASLVSLIKSGFYFLPCGVDGSYKVINPDNNQPSCDFIKALNNIPSSNQPVSFRTCLLYTS
nr:hypothetical protein [Candidatus Shapirobacteria bacterium]